MNVLNTIIPDVKIIQPTVYDDDRGYFYESYNNQVYNQFNIMCNFIQDNESKSHYGVLRGLHYQKYPYTQAKLVRVVSGSVLDVAVDIRKTSPTFGKYVSVELNENNKYQLFIPRGFAHGFLVLSKNVIFSYKCDNIYKPSYEAGIMYNDPDININWNDKFNGNFILSDKDRKHPFLKESVLL